MNSAEGTWPYSIEEIARAIQMGVGRPIVSRDEDNTFFQLGGIGSNVTIQLLYEDEYETTVIAEPEQIISNNGFNPFFPNLLGINFDAIADRNNVRIVMDHIISNLNALSDSGEIDRMRESDMYCNEDDSDGEYYEEDGEYYDEDEEYYDEDGEYYDDMEKDEEW